MLKSTCEREFYLAILAPNAPRCQNTTLCGSDCFEVRGEKESTFCSLLMCVPATPRMWWLVGDISDQVELLHYVKTQQVPILNLTIIFFG